MVPVLAASAYEIVLAVHIMAVVITFGVTFALPIMFVVAARHQPSALAVLHRIEYTIERVLINPGLLVILGAGIFLASDGKHWSQFFVQWGIGVVVVLGAVVGSVMIPAAKKAEQLAADPSTSEYAAVTRRLNVVGSLLSALVLVTILFMVVKP